MAEGVKRKISAILSADVVGYSKLMEADEESTVRTVESYRKTVSSLIGQHDGHVIDSPGDNILSEFGSVVDAVQCAVEVQHIIRAKNAGLPETRRMEFRIGINLGDLIEEEDRTYGEGVNIASRIEGMAGAGGICISESAYQQIRRKLSFGYEDLGEHTLKNITDPVRVYRIPMDSRSGIDVATGKRVVDRKWRNIAIGVTALFIVVVGVIVVRDYLLKPSPSSEVAKSETATVPAKQAEPSLLEKPSIAVLPFTNMSSDPEQEYFADGMTEEIISRLSRDSMLTVIARNSVFTYKGKPIKVQQVADELKVQHVLEGSVRKEGNQIRITAQLVDARTGGHLWSETYDKELKDVFSIQDEIAQQIAQSLGHEYWTAAMERVRRIPTESLTAYDLVLKGHSYMSRVTKENTANARKMYERAIELDPDYADAYAQVGMTHWTDLVMATDPKSLELMFEAAEKAISIDDSLSVGHRILAHYYQANAQHELALAKIKRAISLDPNSSDAYHAMSVINNNYGRPKDALKAMEKAMQLNPHYPAPYLVQLAWAYRGLERYEEAIAALNEAVALNPDWPITYYNFAWVYNATGRYRDAIELSNETVKRFPDGRWWHTRILPWSYLGLWESQQSENPQVLDKALEIAQKHIDLDKNSPLGHYALALIYLHKKQYDQAISEAEKTGWALGSVHNQMGRYGDTIVLAEEGLQANPESTYFLDLLGQAYHLSGRHEDAVAQLEKLLALTRDYSLSYRTHLQLAILYGELGRVNEAEAEAQEVLNLVPHFSVKTWGERNPMKDQAQVERDMAALRKAGLN